MSARVYSKCMPHPTLPLSIIIPTLNEEAHIENILTDIIHSNISPVTYEIIVSDSGSNDHTHSNITNIKKQYPDIQIKFFVADRKGVSIARNTGAKHAKGQYLVFLDADSRISKDFLTSNLMEMQKRQLDAGGCYAVPDSARWLDSALFSIVNNLCFRGLQYTSKPMCLGAAIWATSAIHKQIGGFNQKILFGEDVEYVTAIQRIATFRMLNSTPVTFSMRRGEKEGRFQLVGKAIKGFLYHLFHRSMKNVDVTYKFGHYDK